MYGAQSGYYGPPIPPQPLATQPSYAAERRRRCFCSIGTAVAAFLAIFGIAVIVLWLVFRPQKIVVAVTDAVLYRFDLATTTKPPSLAFNLSATVSVRNPNKRVGIVYDWLEADSYYYGARLGWVSLPTLYQGHRSTSAWRPAVAGSSYVDIGSSGIADFKNQNSTGSFGVGLWLFGRVRYRFGSATTKQYVLRVQCVLKLRLLAPGAANNGFVRTPCKVLKW
uniref:Late embryogenesis abundant protein LEA-2 subgroup domain-containing protein n=1 Tax=Ananas comosus var. bracteatus TaxID=296719 RepID=A0A6V7NHF8_ANACO|nr:unnamed protein product [Ananas comosus var. bracteatus]